MTRTGTALPGTNEPTSPIVPRTDDMRATPTVEGDGWRAELSLSFERRGERTVLGRQLHTGPLLVQRALHPEGDAPCHAILLHPPAGIVGGDRLHIDVTCGPDAHALLTTPGATKWYRAHHSGAGMATQLRAARGARIEYLPREAIVYDGACATATLEMDLDTDSRMLGWDLWCLGRTASGERFDRGRLQLVTTLRRAGRLRWEERGALDGGSSLLAARAGFAGEPVFGTLWAVGPQADRSLLDACRAIRPRGAGQGSVTQLPEVLFARYLGPSTEEAFEWFVSLWSLLRPAYVGMAPAPPRIWAV